MKIFGINLAPKSKAVKNAPKYHAMPQQVLRIRQDAQTRREAIEEAERVYFPYRYKMQRMYLNTAENGHITGLVERRKDLTLLRKWEFINAVTGEIDQATTDIFCYTVNDQTKQKKWFSEFVSAALDALFYGYTLVYLNDLVNGEFPKMKVVPRWYVSPDRKELMSYPNMPTGMKFEEEEEFRDWYVYIDTPNEQGVSPCGMGLYLKLSIYEIFARNLLGFNGDFVELFAQPFRVGTTSKTEGPERDAFEAAIRDMGSAGYMIKDSMDDAVEFLESSLGGTGYQGYDNFEARLEKAMSKIVLGHPDAMASVPGKLGNDSADSPAQQALRDKQTKDGEFITQVVNHLLFPRLRALGFSIPDGVVAQLKNDNEEVDNANNVSDLAVKMMQAGLQMDAAYFTEKTGIPVADKAAPTPQTAKVIPASISNKLKNFYGA